MKKLFTLIVLSIFVLTITTMAIADTGNFYFSLTPPTEQFTGTVNKADGEQAFYVTTTSNNLKDGDAFWYGPRRGTTVMSSGLKFTNAKASAQKAYYTRTAYAGDSMKLRGNSRYSDITSGSTYTITTAGRWTP